MKQILIFLFVFLSCGWSLERGNNLPSEITAFYAEQQDLFILIKWQTQDEQATHHFVVQRSPDGKEWENWKRKHALAEGAPVMDYVLPDRELHPQTVYYRIKQVDPQGNVRYFPEIISVNPDREVNLSTQY